MKPNIDTSTQLSSAPKTTGHELRNLASTAHVLTSAQTRALDLMVALGNLFYGGHSSHGCTIKPRLFPLLVGPTGAGKSWLVRQAAETLGVKLLHFTFGTWVPLGARHDRPTQITIIDALLRHERVALHFDEIDKVGISANSDWSRGIFNDLFNVLDHQLESALFFNSEGPARGGRDEDAGRELIAKYQPFGLLQPCHVETSGAFGRFISDRARAGLWVVGSGTWQRLFDDNNESRRIGFRRDGDATETATSGEVRIIERVRRGGLIPSELMARFSTEIILVTYPSNAELAQLLESLGIYTLARSVGISVRVDDLDLRVAGMRTLESLVTRLLLRQQALQFSEQTMLGGALGDA